METQVTNVKHTLPTEMPTSWGTDQITTDQIEITRIKLMQSTSEAVKSEKNKSGELVNKTTGEVVGGRGKPIEVIIFNKVCYWIVYEKDANGKSQFKEVFPLTPANSQLKRQDGNLKRVPVWEFYCLPANDTAGIPWIIPFGGSSFKHAKKLLSVMKNAKGSMGSFTYLLDTVVEKWNDNSYYVFSAKQGKKTTSEQEMAAYKWFVDTEKTKEAALEHVETTDASEEESTAVPF